MSTQNNYSVLRYNKCLSHLPCHTYIYSLSEQCWLRSLTWDQGAWPRSGICLRCCETTKDSWWTAAETRQQLITDRPDCSRELSTLDHEQTQMPLYVPPRHFFLCVSFVFVLFIVYIHYIFVSRSTQLLPSAAVYSLGYIILVYLPASCCQTMDSVTDLCH